MLKYLILNNYYNKMNSKNKFIYLDKLTTSINPIHHKLINEILLSDSTTYIYNELNSLIPRNVKIIEEGIKYNFRYFKYS